MAVLGWSGRERVKGRNMLLDVLVDLFKLSIHSAFFESGTSFIICYQTSQVHHNFYELVLFLALFFQETSAGQWRTVGPENGLPQFFARQQPPG